MIFSKKSSAPIGSLVQRKTKHYSSLAALWALTALGACVAGFYADALTGHHPARWLHAALGVMMMLIVVAMSRISMRIVNAAIKERAADPARSVEYRARPPRRNLAIFCIGLYMLAELLAPGARIGGWLALAAATALLGLADLLWGAAFALYAWRMAPLFLAPRADGGSGCEGVLAH